MSLISSCEPLNCDSCPFLDCYEKGSCYQCYCFLNKTIDLDDHCDHKTYPLDCPLLDGMVMEIKVIDGNLLIGHDHQ